MNQNLKKMISYYKPYRAVFAADMLFATLSAAVALTIPLVVRYVTSTLIYQQPQMMLRKLFLIGIGLLQPVFYRKLWTCDGGKDGI